MNSLKSFDTVKTSKEFNYIYKNAKAFHAKAFVIFYLHNIPSKVGFVASKKVGNAVYRNRSKRLLRSLFIAHHNQFQSCAYVLVAKPNLLTLPYEKLQKDCLYALDYLHKGQKHT